MPKRIQRKRTRGWKMPANAVYVGRPTKWGNPFPWRGDWIVWAAVAAGYRADAAGRKAAAVAYFRDWLADRMEPGPHADDDGCSAVTFESGVTLTMGEHCRGIAAMAAAICGGSVRVPPPPSLDEIRAELRGKDLVCWCPEDAPHCHADVLLELANAPEGKGE